VANLHKIIEAIKSLLTLKMNNNFVVWRVERAIKMANNKWTTSTDERMTTVHVLCVHDSGIVGAFQADSDSIMDVDVTTTR